MEDVMMPVFIIVIDEIVFNTVVYVLAFLLRNRTSLMFYIIHVFLPQIVLTVIATVIIYRFYVWINKYLKKKVGENEIA